MADEYTPTTAEMSDAYVQMRVREARGETGTERIWTATDALSEFKRGLAAYEAGLRERIAQDILAREPEIRGYVDFEQHRDSCVGEINGLRRAARIARGATR